MNLLETLTQKPWLDKSAGDAIPEDPAEGLRRKQIALNFFLGIVTVLFSLFIVTFLARSQYPDFSALAADVWQPFYQPARLWINTALLFTSGVAIQFSLYFIRRDHIRLALTALTLSLLFALEFLVAQFMLWQHLHNLGFYLASNPANSYFYLLTGIHGIHLLGGIIALAHAATHFWRGNNKKLKPQQSQLKESIQLCCKYWHYLFAVWLALFFLMTRSPETYKTLAALCGY